MFGAITYLPTFLQVANGASASNSRVAHLLGAAPAGLTPADIGNLPTGERAQLAEAFADGITVVFRYAVPLLVVGFLLTWLLKEVPLRGARHTPTPAGDDTPAVPAGASAVPSDAAPAWNGTVAHGGPAAMVDYVVDAPLADTGGSGAGRVRAAASAVAGQADEMSGGQT